MPYRYEDYKPKFGDDRMGRKLFEVLASITKYVRRRGEPIFTVESVMTGDSWEFLAVIDRLKEIGVIQEFAPDGPFAQHRRFMLSNWTGANP